MEYRTILSPIEAMNLRVAPPFAALFALAMAYLWWAGWLHWPAALFLGGFTVLGAAWEYARTRPGTATMTVWGIDYRARGRGRFAWKHISGITLGEGRFAPRIDGTPIYFFYRVRDVPCVVVTLNRAPRLTLTWMLATDRLGIPLQNWKTVHIFVEDPAAFIRDAQPYLESARR